MITRNSITSPLRVSCVVLLAFALFQWNRPGGFHPLDQALQFARRDGLMESVLDKAHRLAMPGLHLEHTNEAGFSRWEGFRLLAIGYDAAESDPRRSELSAGADQWRLLLLVDTDDGLNMMWEDGGLLYFWVRESDAAEGDFSKVWMFLQSG